MKFSLYLFLIMMNSVAFSQTYSTVISDSLIIDFINLDIKRESMVNKKLIRNEITALNKEDYYYKDSIDFNFQNKRYPFFIFGRHDLKGRILSHGIDSFFTREDIDFFLLQLDGITKRKHWKNPFINSILVNKIEQDENKKVEKVMFTYSLPLFSADKKKALIIKGFFCGLLCGGGATYIFKKNNNNEWGE